MVWMTAALLWAWALLRAALALRSWTTFPYGQCCWLSVQEEHWKNRVSLVAIGIASMVSSITLSWEVWLIKKQYQLHRWLLPWQTDRATSDGGMWYPCTWGRYCKVPSVACSAAKLCYRRWHEETGTNKQKMPNLWVVMSQWRIANISDSLYVF